MANASSAGTKSVLIQQSLVQRSFFVLKRPSNRDRCNASARSVSWGVVDANNVKRQSGWRGRMKVARSIYGAAGLAGAVLIGIVTSWDGAIETALAQPGRPSPTFELWACNN